MNPNPSHPLTTLNEIIQQVAQDLKVETQNRQVALEFDVDPAPLESAGSATAIQQALSLIVADTVLRSEIGDSLLITLVAHGPQWEIEVADARETCDEESSRMEWMSRWPPLQNAVRGFSGSIEWQRCPQGGWAVTLSGTLARQMRAAG